MMRLIGVWATPEVMETGFLDDLAKPGLAGGRRG
jgi:hypothetical protein